MHLPGAAFCVFQAEVCAGTVAEVIQSVVNGADGCVFCFGHAKLGKWKLDLLWCSLGHLICDSVLVLESSMQGQANVPSGC